MEIHRILIIQTAFVGDVILATPLIEKLKSSYPNASVDFLLRKGNEELLEHDYRISGVLIWEKKKRKYRSWFSLLKKVRARKYDLLINAHRFGSTGLWTLLSGARMKVGFDKNPFSFAYSKRVSHEIVEGAHEVDRNLSLLTGITETTRCRPSLCIEHCEERVTKLKHEPYLVMAPASVWFTKQLPAEKWIELINGLQFNGVIYLIGSKSDYDLCEHIKDASQTTVLINMSGKLTLPESAALMKDAQMSYVNDSAPMHLASAVNASVTVFYCSTVPRFGFGPMSDDACVVQIQEELSCRPCGLHGKSQCPERHFKCGMSVSVQEVCVWRRFGEDRV